MPERYQVNVHDPATDKIWNISLDGDGVVTLDGETINAATALVPFEYDYIALTYVSAGNGAGEVETATYKDGGSGGTTQATLTITYDSSNRVSTVTRA